MSAFDTERVLAVRHWTDAYFSFTTTRSAGLRFENGQFVMIGLPVDGRPLVRAYSIASANWEEEMEFFSIKVADGPLTSRLQHIQPGSEILVSRKPTGTLLIHDLHKGRNLYLLGTGTGLAPFLAIIKDPETYERFERVVVCHGVRHVADLCYRDYIQHELQEHDLLGEILAGKLLYYPAVTREDFVHRGRLTELMASGAMMEHLGIEPLDAAHDRAMICGSPQMLADFRELLDARGFTASPRIGTPAEYVFERAFVEK
ncbi:ferredoxin--NADP reductase [Coralloluteibacterium stylophorae]|uniref:ferredoxin--NADP(+) reductase n=1 Tax=Coralloluteibacterium stylophorae TaxID=1776034 RepID=A0A8J7VS83_9GAMM|nr:ferredoxin--NADP reductase [Coralloluteibacterium stylophorae]MBS7455853.1 ferredoxin--NADP reductase [Coralloluteibacterium stylophorae]